MRDCLQIACASSGGGWRTATGAAAAGQRRGDGSLAVPSQLLFVYTLPCAVVAHEGSRHELVKAVMSEGALKW